MPLLLETKTKSEAESNLRKVLENKGSAYGTYVEEVVENLISAIETPDGKGDVSFLTLPEINAIVKNVVVAVASAPNGPQERERLKTNYIQFIETDNLKDMNLVPIGKKGFGANEWSKITASTGGRKSRKARKARKTKRSTRRV